MTASRPRRAALRMLVAGLLVIAGIAVAPPTAGSTSDDLAGAILSWVNGERAALGLRPLRRDATLPDVAAERAANLAAAGVLSHDAAGGSIGEALTARGYTWYGTGETIGYITGSFGLTAAQTLYEAWRNSPDHWALLMSSAYNYVGVGVAYRPANGATYGSIVLAEAPDHTAPTARMVTRGRSGSTIWFTWAGADPLLQARTAGLRDFDVQYRPDSGTWRLIRDNTTSTGIRIASRPSEHRYYVRVRSRDWRGNLSPWSAAYSIWVP